jgi:hypothetical protein
MDNPDPAKATVTIKAIEVEAWEMAKRAATKRGETQGEWVSHACRYVANLQSGDEVRPPGKPDNPAPVVTPYAAEAHAFAALLTACGAAGVTPSRDAMAKVNRLFVVLGARLPPTRKPRLTVSGQSLPGGKPQEDQPRRPTNVPSSARTISASATPSTPALRAASGTRDTT